MNNNYFSNGINNTSSNASNGAINFTLSLQERAIIIENIKKFLLEHLPLEQCNSPQKAYELAVRFENHVAITSSTKEQYHGMIAEKLRMIKSKSVNNNTTLNIPTSSPTEPSPSFQSQVSNSTSASAANSSSPSNIQLSPQEIAQVTGRLNQIRPQIPQIDKLLLLHSKLPNPPLGTIDLVKKLTDCRNVLVNQIEVVQGGPDSVKRIKSMSAGYLIGLGQLNLLIEQVQRLFNSLVGKMKESAGVGGITPASTGISGSPPMPNISASSSNLLNSASSICSSTSSSSTANMSEGASSSSFKIKLKPQATPQYDKLLLQRLSLPPDSPILITDNFHDNYVYRDILRRNADVFHLQSTNQKHLKLRNILLSKELEVLKESYRIKVQDDGLGIINVLVHAKKCLFIFKISKKYPFDELLYRINATDNNTAHRLPKHLEPKSFPISITNIIRNYESNFQ